MPAPVSPLFHALRLLKVELVQPRGVAEGNRSNATNGAARTDPAAAPQMAPPAAFQALSAQLRAARTADGKLPPGKALRLFVQAALLDELGEDLQLDPALGNIVERTCTTLEQDDSCAPVLAEALRDLEALSR